MRDYTSIKNKPLRTKLATCFVVFFSILIAILPVLARAIDYGDWFDVCLPSWDTTPPYTENFENFNLGNIDGQFGWSGQKQNGGGEEALQVIDYNGNKVLRVAPTGLIPNPWLWNDNLFSLSADLVEFDFTYVWNSGGWQQGFRTRLKSGENYPDTNYLIRYDTEPYTFPLINNINEPNSRVRIQYKKDLSDYFNYTRYSIAQKDWSDWAFVNHADNIETLTGIWFQFGHDVANTSQYFYIDDFTISTSETATEPILSFVYPENNAEILELPVNIGVDYDVMPDYDVLNLQGENLENFGFISEEFDLTENVGTANFNLTEAWLNKGTWKFNLSLSWYEPEVICGTQIFEEPVLYLNILQEGPVLPVWYEVKPFEPTSGFLGSADYYIEHSTYDTPTGVYTALSNTIGQGFVWINEVLRGLGRLSFAEKGQEFGEALSQGRAYLASIDSFFNGFPITFCLFAFLTSLIVVAVLRIVKFIRGLLPF